MRRLAITVLAAAALTAALWWGLQGPQEETRPSTSAERSSERAAEGSAPTPPQANARRNAPTQARTERPELDVPGPLQFRRTPKARFVVEKFTEMTEELTPEQRSELMDALHDAQRVWDVALEKEFRSHDNDLQERVIAKAEGREPERASTAWLSDMHGDVYEQFKVRAVEILGAEEFRRIDYIHPWKGLLRSVGLTHAIETDPEWKPIWVGTGR